MKKVLFLLFVLTSLTFAQNDVTVWGMHTWQTDSTRTILTNSDTTYFWVSAPNMYDYSTAWPAIASGGTATKPTNLKIPYNGESFFNGNFYVGVYPKFGYTKTLDSLQVRFSPYDNRGVVFTNDVRYLDFSDGTASSTVKWKLAPSTNSALGASSNGESVPMPGFRFMVIQKDTDCIDTLVFKIFKN